MRRIRVQIVGMSLAVGAALGATGGCARQAASAGDNERPIVVVYEDRPAAALVLPGPVVRSHADAEDRPVVAAVPPVVLDRSLRVPRAFIGFESLVQEYFWLRTDDRFRFGQGSQDRFERRAVSTRFGVIER